WGVRRAIIAGRSAGGLGALELAATGKISQATLVYAAEPVGCQTFANGDGKRSYNQYLKLQKRLMAGDSKLPEGQRYFIHPRNDAKELPLRAQASRIASMVLLNVAEAYYNESHWGQDVVADYATAISARGVPVHIDFADISMVLPADHAQKSSYLDRLSNGAHRESGVSTREQPGTMHRSFDNRDFFARCLAAAVQQRTGIELPNA
ncbi:MAG TPA: hypothetical protein VFH39_00230, partial [Candidatus Saccharimonadales bacterium]|nr:hypothetical protein [Candidatus Saccharimonadales bacterium]